MTAREFIRVSTKFAKDSDLKLKIKKHPKGKLRDIGLDDKMPARIYGFAIYGKVD